MELAAIIGTLAGIITTGSFLPQIIKIVKEKSTKDISLMMYSVLIVGFIMWIIYGFMIKEFPIILANGVSLVLGLTILSYKIKLG